LQPPESASCGPFATPLLACTADLGQHYILCVQGVEVCLAISVAMSSNGVALLACLSLFASDALCFKNSEHFLPARQILGMRNWGNVFIEAVTESVISLQPIYGQ